MVRIKLNLLYKRRQQEHGFNELKKAEKESIWAKILEQFKDTVVQILLLSAVISFVISQLEDTHEDHAVPACISYFLNHRGRTSCYIYNFDIERSSCSLLRFRC